MAAFLPPQIRALKDFLNFAVLGVAGWGPQEAPDLLDYFAR